MSRLQYQLRELLPRLSAEAKKLQDPEAKKRYYLIRAVAMSVRDVKKACESRGESTRVFYKWANRLIETESLGSLMSESRAPKYNPKKLDPRLEKRICRIRRKYPFKGPEQILFELKKNKSFKMLPHPSTIYQVLLRNDLIKEEYKKALTKKHIKRYRRPVTGYLQMDFKYVPYLINGEKYYQLSCVDHHSSWRLVRCYPNKDLIAVEDFLLELEKLCPFTIRQLQTDNDGSFTDKYRVNTDGFPTGEHIVDQWCKKHGIEHKLIPIGKKELNGKVENTHKWDDREFYSQYQATGLKDLQRATKAHNKRWNQERATATLDWQTPLQVIYKLHRTLLFLKLWFHSKAVELGLTTTSLDKYGNFKVEVPRQLPNKPVKLAKKESTVDRYLQYQDWEQANHVLPISPNFSHCFGRIESEFTQIK